MCAMKRTFFGLFQKEKGNSTVTCASAFSDTEELPDLVLPRDPTWVGQGRGKNVLHDTDIEGTKSGSLDTGKGRSTKSGAPTAHSGRLQARGLEIKHGVKRTSFSELETVARKRSKLSTDNKLHSPEVIDITDDDQPEMYSSQSVKDENVVLIDFDGLDELAEGYDRKIIPDFLAKNIFANITDSKGHPEATSLVTASTATNTSDIQSGGDIINAVIVLTDDEETENGSLQRERQTVPAFTNQVHGQETTVSSTSGEIASNTNTEMDNAESELQLDHRRKKLYDHQRPVFKMVKQLKDIARNQQYLIRNNKGEISLENDNVAQYIIDMGVLLRQSGQELKDMGKGMQKKISDARAEEELQLKAELSDAEDFQETRRMRNPRRPRSKMFYSMRKQPAVRKEQKPPKNAEDVLNRKHICQVCGFAYINRDDLETHLNKHADNQIVCDVCGKGFYSLRRFRTHEASHSSGFLTCSICGIEKENKSDLKSHVSRHGRERFVCTVEGCEKSYLDKGNWVIHVKSEHTNARPVKCQICGRHYRNANVARAHASRDHR